MGIAWATKWIGIYASAGLAVLFFWALLRRWREYRFARAQLRAKAASDGFCAGVVQAFRHGAWRTILFCVVFFVLIPVLIYYGSYFWHLRGMSELDWARKGVTGFEVTSLADMFTPQCVRRVIDLQKEIFDYHAGLGGDTHSFRSEWYEWPIIWWPMWYYTGTAYLPGDGMISSISCMGNPAVWWFGLAAMLFVIARASFMRRAPKSYAMVLVAFASQFLPWVLVAALDVHLPLFCQRAVHHSRQHADAQVDPLEVRRGVQGDGDRADGGGAGAVHRLLSAGIGPAGGARIRAIPALVQVGQLLIHVAVGILPTASAHARGCKTTTFPGGMYRCWRAYSAAA